MIFYVNPKTKKITDKSQTTIPMEIKTDIHVENIDKILSVRRYFQNEGHLDKYGPIYTDFKTGEDTDLKGGIESIDETEIARDDIEFINDSGYGISEFPDSKVRTGSFKENVSAYNSVPLIKLGPVTEETIKNFNFDDIMTSELQNILNESDYTMVYHDLIENIDMESTNTNIASCDKLTVKLSRSLSSVEFLCVLPSDFEGDTITGFELYGISDATMIISVNGVRLSWNIEKQCYDCGNYAINCTDNTLRIMASTIDGNITILKYPYFLFK